MKKCRTCKVEMDLVKFRKDLSKKDNKCISCKVCEAVKREKLSRTKNGVIQTLYSGMRGICKRHQWTMPSFTKNELQQYLLEDEGFNRLYEVFVKSDYKTTIKIDRVDHSLNFTLQNIQVATFRENTKIRSVEERVDLIIVDLEEAASDLLCQQRCEKEVNFHYNKYMKAVNKKVIYV